MGKKKYKRENEMWKATEVIATTTTRKTEKRHMTIIIRMDEENMKKAAKVFHLAVRQLNSQIDGEISYEMIKKTIRAD